MENWDWAETLVDVVPKYNRHRGQIIIEIPQITQIGIDVAVRETMAASLHSNSVLGRFILLQRGWRWANLSINVSLWNDADKSCCGPPSTIWRRVCLCPPPRPRRSMTACLGESASRQVWTFDSADATATAGKRGGNLQGSWADPLPRAAMRAIPPGVSPGLLHRAAL